jgi:predicted PurR-regulated permease PerM
MTTTDQVLIIILCVLLSVFFALCIAVMIVVLKLIGSIRQIVDRAEEAVESVESAAEVLKNTSGRLAFFKLMRNIMKMMQGKK